MTGIVRRVDDLGRIVIPRDIRKFLNIKEGDPLEIDVAHDSIILKPYVEDKYNKVDSFMEAFQKMNQTDKKNVLKMLIEEMG